MADDGEDCGGLVRGDTWDAVLGGVRLLSGQCSTCVGRPGNLMHLAPGRLKKITDANRANGTYLVCHQTLRNGMNPGAGEALCRWFYDLPDSTTFIQIGNRLGWWREVPPPAHEATPTGEDTPDDHQ